MNLSFYSAGAGASAQQTRLDIIANNVTNINTVAYKTKNATFSDLVYKNIREPEGDISKLRQGCGARVEKTDTLFGTGALYETSSPFDFAIIGDGFFAVENPNTNTVSYTRDGSFALSESIDGKFYLVTSKNDFVLDKNGNRIEIENETSMPDIGIFDFQVKDGILSAGDNLFRPTPKNGTPFLNTNSQLERKSLEMSNVNLGAEMTKMIQAQRSYQLSLRMVQTSDEIEGTVNNLRG